MATRSPRAGAITDAQCSLNELRRSFAWPDGVLDALHQAEAALDEAYMILDEDA
jgi:hypothetical protein